MNVIEELKGLENHFFQLDKEGGVATIQLRFDKASELMDSHYLSKEPVMNEDFLNRIRTAFELIPPSYQLDLDVRIWDFETYTEAKLQQLFHDNILLEYKAKRRLARAKNNLAFCLIGAGILFFVMMVAAGRVWPEGGLVHDIFFYISDIAATVTIWEALGILLVEGRENRIYRRSLISRFHAISFHSEQEEC